MNVEGKLILGLITGGVGIAFYFLRWKLDPKLVKQRKLDKLEAELDVLKKKRDRYLSAEHYDPIILGATVNAIIRVQSKIRIIERQ